jgi:translation elongation factor EF-4
VDAGQGVQAQTLANFYLAFDANLAVIPVLTKIDLSTRNIDDCLEQMQNMFDIPPAKVLRLSAKTGEGMDKLIPTIIERIPP